LRSEINELSEILDPFHRLPDQAMYELPFVLPRKSVYQISELLLLKVAKTMVASTQQCSGPFNFLPSSSLRSDGPASCRAFECQIERLDLLARYAGLYADHILIPIPHCMVSDNLFEARSHLALCLLKLRRLWPLIEAGIAKPFIDEYPFCQHHGTDFDRMSRRLLRCARDYYEGKLDEFTVIYRPKHGRLPAALEVSGPSDLVEHGAYMLTYPRDAPGWAPMRTALIGDRPGARLSKSAVRRHRIGLDIFERFVEDMVFQGIYGASFGAQYLTDLPGEAEFIDEQRPKNHKFANAAMVCRALAHSVPLLSSIPIKQLLRVRTKETNAFELYRAALGRITQEHIQSGDYITAKEARDIYTDVLRPELLKLNQAAVVHGREQRRKTVATLAASGVALTLGVVGSLHGGILAPLLTAMGGGGLAKEAINAILSGQKNPPDVQRHEMYFLLKLLQTTSS
jgi:hypothetical protein